MIIIKVTLCGRSWSQVCICSTIQHATVGKHSHILLKDNTIFNSIFSWDTRSRMTFCTFRWWTELRQKPSLPTRLYRLGKIPSDKKVKFLRENPCSWKAVHFTGICQNNSDSFPKAKIPGKLCSWGLLGQKSTIKAKKKKIAFNVKWTQLLYWTVSGVQAKKDPCLCSKTSTVINQSTFCNHQSTQFHQNQMIFYSTYFTLKSCRFECLSIFEFEIPPLKMYAVLTPPNNLKFALFFHDHISWC